MTLDVVRLSAIVGIGSGAVVGRRLGPYRLLEKVGTGAHAAVYRARHELMGVERAVKVPRPGAAWPEQGERFLSEARVAARLRHPNVVSVHDCGRAPDGTPYIVMELVPGRTLAQRLADGVPSAAETLRVAEQVARALDHAHRAGVVHRDVKPANVLLAEDGGVRLGDFGIAHLEAEPQSGETWAGAGTPAYMAPEQRRGERGVLGAHTDVYGLAAVLYEMLTGRPPIAGPGAEPPAPCAVNPYLPAAVDAVLAGGLAADPTRRPASASDLVASLAGAIGTCDGWPAWLDGEDGAGAGCGTSAGGRTVAREDRPTASIPLSRRAPVAAAAPSRRGPVSVAGWWRR